MTDGIPETIKNHQYGTILGRIWNEVHRNEGIVTIVFCGKRGKGKSFSMMEWARILDRSPSTDQTRFVPENVRLDAVEFFKDLTGKYPVGKVICLDDAGLHMYKSDALTDLLKRISKILQNIRYKHPIILLSLPHFGQLMKDARDMCDLYIEMQGINKEKKRALGNIQTLKISPFTSNLYRYTVLQSQTLTHPEFDIKYKRWYPDPYEFEAPPKDFLIEYEKIKEPAMDKINKEHLKAITNQRNAAISGKTPIKMRFADKLEYCKQHLKEIMVNGEIEVSKIRALKDIVISVNDSRLIKRNLKLESIGGETK